MPILRLCFLFIFSIFSFLPADQNDLQTELMMMEQEDQMARVKILQLTNPSEEDIIEIDRSHRLRLQEIVSLYGWPGIQLVGLEGATAMWLLVQHQDEDVIFQKHCLSLLKDAVEKQEAPYWHYAYLLDRVRKNEGLLQAYGTQWIRKEGKLSLYVVEDPENLEQRRAAAGLCTMQEYKKQMIEGLYLNETDFD